MLLLATSLASMPPHEWDLDRRAAPSRGNAGFRRLHGFLQSEAPRDALYSGKTTVDTAEFIGGDIYLFAAITARLPGPQLRPGVFRWILSDDYYMRGDVVCLFSPSVTRLAFCYLHLGVRQIGKLFFFLIFYKSFYVHVLRAPSLIVYATSDTFAIISFGPIHIDSNFLDLLLLVSS